MNNNDGSNKVIGVILIITGIFLAPVGIGIILIILGIKALG